MPSQQHNHLKRVRASSSCSTITAQDMFHHQKEMSFHAAYMSLESYTATISILKSALAYSLSNFLHDNALFYAERLRSFAQCPSPQVPLNSTDAASLEFRELQRCLPYESVYLVALCYFRSGKIQYAHAALKDTATLPKTSIEKAKDNDNCLETDSFFRIIIRCHYLFARCCVQMKLYQEGERILLKLLDILGDKHVSQDSIPSSLENLLRYGTFSQSNTINDLEPIPDVAAIYCLLGEICRKEGRSKQAVVYLKRSLERNPTIWTSFQGLCSEDPANVNVGDIFNLPREVEERYSTLGALVDHVSNPRNIPSSVSDLSPIASPKQIPNSRHLASRLKTAMSPIISNQEKNVMTSTHDVFKKEEPSPNLSKRKVQNMALSPLAPASPKFGRSPSSSSLNAGTITSGVRRSTRLSRQSKNLSIDDKRKNSNKPNATHGSSMDALSPQQENMDQSMASLFGKENVLGLSNTSMKNSCLPNLKMDAMTSPLSLISTPYSMEVQVQALKCVFELLRNMGKAVRYLNLYESRQAIKQITELPVYERNSSWTLEMLGKAYFESVEYHEAFKAFQRLRLLKPYHFEGLEIYANVLWHLRDEIVLSSLAQELTKFDRMSPTSWCVLGNCFSLRKDHDIAMSCFQRAISLDRSYAYAHTLTGHEHISNEDFDKALQCFREAVRIDKRHYNAWYGLGMIYFRQEKYDFAEYHYRQAIKINPSSSVLYCYLGMVVQAKHNIPAAIQYYDRAIRLDPRNPFVRFKKAKALAKLGDYENALKELFVLKDMASKEPAVYFLISHMYKRLGNTHNTMLYFNWAQDLDMRGSNSVKESLDSNRTSPDLADHIDGLGDMVSQKGESDVSDEVGDDDIGEEEDHFEYDEEDSLEDAEGDSNVDEPVRPMAAPAEVTRNNSFLRSNLTFDEPMDLDFTPPAQRRANLGPGGAGPPPIIYPRDRPSRRGYTTASAGAEETPDEMSPRVTRASTARRHLDLQRSIPQAPSIHTPRQVSNVTPQQSSYSEVQHAPRRQTRSMRHVDSQDYTTPRSGRQH